MTLSKCRLHWFILASSSQSRYTDLEVGSETGGLIMFSHIQIDIFRFQVKRFFIKGTARKPSNFPWGNRLRSRLVTLLLNPIPWHSQDQVIVKSTWLFIKSGSNLVDGLLAKRDLGQSRRCVPPILLLMGGFPFYFDSLL